MKGEVSGVMKAGLKGRMLTNSDTLAGLGNTKKGGQGGSKLWGGGKAWPSDLENNSTRWPPT